MALALFSCRGKESLSPDVSGDIGAKEKPKILYVDSYNWDYEWARHIRQGLFHSLRFEYNEKGEPLGEEGLVQLKIFEMNTKAAFSEEDKVLAGERARDLIESWKPDLVITSDDNAAKYLIKPYFVDSSIPFLYCGINNSAAAYGFPASNVTGMVEVHDVRGVMELLKPYAKGERVGFLSGENLSGRKNGREIEEQLGYSITDVYVKTYKEWKKQYRRLQDEVDILFLESVEYFPDWDGNMKALSWFATRYARVPSGTGNDALKSVALITMESKGEEQGEWVGNTALSVLSGELSFRYVGEVKNSQVSIHLNMMLAREQNIRFPAELINISHLVNELSDTKKVLYVNSYHEGYAWSDEVQEGVEKALSRSKLQIDYKYVLMDTLNKPEDAIKDKALEIKGLIERWKPDIVIASDDNASKYLIQPYCGDSEIPFVFCGVNWSADEYGFPYENMTGMIESAPVEEAYALVRSFAEGERIGVIGKDSYFARRLLDAFKKRTGREVDAYYPVNTLEEWEEAYGKLQDEADMIFITSLSNIAGYDREYMVDRVLESSRVPSVCFLSVDIPFALVGASQMGEEQGWWAGNAALEILEGREPGSIPLAQNSQVRIHLNIPLADEMGLVFPRDLLDSSTIYHAEGR
ncbi:MAG: ABC transporter substrate binding protein [Spirochaetales bacterium]|nr:ABC transporter substrate binding protein [Spirochaetales bacterium]